MRLRCQIGTPIFSTIRNKNLHRILKAALKTAQIPDYSKYVRKGSRRGRAAEVIRSRPMLSTILGIGGWRGAGCKYYLSLHEGAEEAITDLMKSMGDRIDSSDSAPDNDSASDREMSSSSAESTSII